MSDLNVVDPTPSPAAATPAAPSAPATVAPFAPPVATPPAPVAAPTAAPDDRSNWVPPHRIREIRESAQRQYAEAHAQHQAQLEHYQNQIRALVGATPPPNTEHEAVRQQFSQLYPGLAKVETFADKLESYASKMEELESAVDYIWRNHGRQSMDRIFKHAEESLGAPINDEGKRALHAAFTGWVQSSPEYSQRYVDDPELVNEFWKTLSSTLVDPARRNAAVAATQRVPQGLPQDRPAGVPAPPGPPKPSGLDERANMAWVQFQQERNRGL